MVFGVFGSSRLKSELCPELQTYKPKTGPKGFCVSGKNLGAMAKCGVNRRKVAPAAKCGLTAKGRGDESCIWRKSGCTHPAFRPRRCNLCNQAFTHCKSGCTPSTRTPLRTFLAYNPAFRSEQGLRVSGLASKMERPG